MSTNLIIGGTHGLGAEIAMALQQEGEETFVIGRSYDAGVHGPGEQLDLSDLNEVKDFAVRIADMDLKGFWWVAGFGYSGDFATQEDVSEMVAVNFANAMPLAQTAWQKVLPTEKATRFVVVSSTTGARARSNEAVYAATKHAQVGLTRSLGLESERLKSKVRVALFLPGGMKTPFWDKQRPESYETMLDPAKVAKRIVTSVRSQSDFFLEDMIERGKL